MHKNASEKPKPIKVMAEAITLNKVIASITIPSKNIFPIETIGFLYKRRVTVPPERANRLPNYGSLWEIFYQKI
jgi:hypothetical protein